MNKLLFLLFVVFLLMGCEKEKLVQESIVYKKQIEYGETISACNPIESIDGASLTYDSENNVAYAGKYRVSCSKIDTNTLGLQKLYVDIDKQFFVFDIEIVDTTKPKINLIKETVIKDNPNNDFDVSDYFEVEDMSEVEIKIVGEVNLKVNGKYPITIIVKDKYKNETHEEIVFEVDLEENEITEETTTNPITKPVDKEETNEAKPVTPAIPNITPTQPTPTPTPVSPQINCVAGQKHITGVSDFEAIRQITQDTMLEMHATGADAEPYTDETGKTYQDQWIIRWYCN